ncbi:MAG: hypothetical protein CMF62_02590 [Magnetococcales bacterium]|nr:hypothetical protein [Magnetococcales bacterium]|tara:strand:+ start:72171 stop:73208 length:1038 start_codon:yes stop_codon:yes gene_type:complete
MNVELYEKILKDMSFSIVVWNKQHDKITCIFSNNNNQVCINSDFNDYIIKYPYLKNSYNNLFDTNKDQYNNYENKRIKLFYLDDGYYYETRIVNLKKNSSYVFEMALLKNLSSRLREPLTNILGLINYLEKTVTSLEQKKYIKNISISTLKIVELANDVIDIYNLKKNNAKLQMKPFNLKNSIDESVKLIKGFRNSKKINISSIINDSIPLNIIGDKTRIQQVLASLLSISYENTDIGSIIIEVKEYTLEDSKESPFEYCKARNNEINLIFKIRDTGINQNDEKYDMMRTILGIHRDCSTVKKENFHFSLIISKYLCNLMRGNIWIDRLQDYGNMFCFNIILKIN